RQSPTPRFAISTGTGSGTKPIAGRTRAKAMGTASSEALAHHRRPPHQHLTGRTVLAGARRNRGGARHEHGRARRRDRPRTLGPRRAIGRRAHPRARMVPEWGTSKRPDRRAFLTRREDRLRRRRRVGSQKPLRLAPGFLIRHRLLAGLFLR